MLSYELNRDGTEAIYIQIYNNIRRDIERGAIEAGAKLPSKRMLAAHLGVSIITIENAYDQLSAEGYIRSVPKSGYYVEKIVLNHEPVKLAPKNISEEREQLTDNPEPRKELFPFAVWAKTTREVLSSKQAELLIKPSCEGIYELRQSIAEHLKAFRGVSVSPEQIIVGAGTEYLYMLIIMLFDRRSVYALEDPGYRKISDIYKSHNIKCEYIPMCDDGIDIDYLNKTDANIVHISPSHHFPTGVVTSIGKRYRLLGWASEAENRYIIEDDYDSEFRMSGKPISPLIGIDVMDKVIYMNTFSKSLSSTIRISYMVLPQKLLRVFREKLGFYSCTVSTFEQYTLARFMNEGHFEKHINRMRHYYKECRQRLFEAVKSYDIFKNSKISGENAGLHCIAEFDTDMSDNDICAELKKIGFRAVPLRVYYHKHDGDLHKMVIFY